jgi:uncharacterized membrane protein
VIGFVRRHWRDAQTSLWFLPGLLVVAFGAASLLLVETDRRLGDFASGIVFAGEPTAARAILSTAATSLVTIAGVTFSITIVVLQLASSQYSPRVLRMFFSDRITQVTAGVFIGLFVYLLLALRTVRDETEARSSFVPGLTVTVGIALAVGALVLLLVFIHNVASLTEAGTLAARIYESTRESVRRVYPAGSRPVRDGAPEADGAPVDATAAGFVQRIDPGELGSGLEDGGGWVVHAAVPVGAFVRPGVVLARVQPAERVDDEVRACVRAAFLLSEHRDVRADPDFGLRQLSDMAVKALSPGINDPTTAALCVSYLHALLLDLAGRPLALEPESVAEGAVCFHPRSRALFEFAEPLLEVGFYAREHPRVVDAVVAALTDLAACAPQGERAALRRRVADLEAAA